MKIRNGFVSNSSSSSFTCDICGTTESGFDAGLNDFDMSRCIEGHTFCNCHKSGEATAAKIRESLIQSERNRKYRQPEVIQKEINALMAMTDEEVKDKASSDNDPYEIISCFCPICTMEEITNEDALSYLMKKHNTTMDAILAEVKNRFSGNYEQFKNFVNPPKNQ